MNLIPSESEELVSEIERLKSQFQKAKEWNQLCEIQLKNLESIVEDQKSLCARAADALEAIDELSFRTLDINKSDLIAELRKAAQC